MGHFTIHVNGQRVGSVLALETGRLAVCFNRKYPQYRDTEGTPDQVCWTLKRMIPNAKYEPLDMPRLDAWLAELDRAVLPCARREMPETDGLMNI